jgi:hypothetical protein
MKILAMHFNSVYKVPYEVPFVSLGPVQFVLTWGCEANSEATLTASVCILLITAFSVFVCLH